MIITLWKRFVNYIALKNAIQHADKMHAATRKQYYVLKVRNKVGVYDRNRVNLLVEHGVLHKKMKDAVSLRKHSIYYTGKPKPTKSK